MRRTETFRERAFGDAAPAVDYVVYGTTPWDGAWLTEHNLAHALAARRRVLFVEPAVTPLTPLRYGLRRASVAEARRVLGAGLRASGRLHVLRPVTVPPREHPRVRAIAAPLVRAQIRRAVRRLSLERPVVVAARSVVPLLGAAGERGCVYLAKDLVEAGADLLGKDGRAIAAEQRRMFARADLVCAVTERLRETLTTRGVDAAILRHGFHGDLAGAYDNAAPPSEYTDLPRPLLGYAGRIDARLDFAALAAVADRFADGSLVLIGPLSPRLDRRELEVLTSRKNVHMLGPRVRDELPAYVSHLDCSLLPYRRTDWLAHASPLKLWDYLYAGPPVVGSGCEALREYDLVLFAEPPSALAATVEIALSRGKDEHPQRRALALANTWDDRALELEGRVAEHVTGSARRQRGP